MFISGYLGLLTAIGNGTVTECALPGYARQPIVFSDPHNGITYNSNNFTFGQGLRAGQIGRAVYRSPRNGAPYESNGQPFLVLPFPTPLAPGRMPWDCGEAGFIRLSFPDMAGLADGTFTGTYTYTASAPISPGPNSPNNNGFVGYCNDGFDVVSMIDTSQTPGFPQPLINTATMTTIEGFTISISALVRPAGT